jgi:hypothetical protein
MDKTAKTAIAQAKRKTWSDADVAALTIALLRAPLSGPHIRGLAQVPTAWSAWLGAPGSDAARNRLKRAVRVAVPIRVGAA